MSEDAMPRSTDGLEREIQQRRDHLAQTIDELAQRTRPQALARNGAAAAVDRAKTLTHTAQGQLRVERLAAAAGAVVVLAGALLWLRRRR